jgi:hypothetical protein
MINGMKIHCNVPAGLWQLLGRKGPANSKVSSVGFIVGCRAKSKENSSEGHACHARLERLSWLSSGDSGFCPGFSFTEHGVQDR